jgi:hypothetical protein
MWNAWERKVYKVLVGKSEGDYLEDQGVDEIAGGCRVDQVGTG